MPASVDLTGKTFGRLTVIEKHGSINGSVHWNCRCVCGGVVYPSSYSLTGGNTTSCGCKRTDTIKKVCTSHGMCSIPEYKVWSGMKARCKNPGHKDYASYGGRGITVCERWRLSFANFVADMGLRPSLKHSIERRDVDKGYGPDNCYWATADEQSANKRNNRIVEYRGTKMTLRQLANVAKVNYDKLKYRLNIGYSVEEALERLERVI